MTRTARRESALRSFFRTESAGGLILMGVAVLALVLANSPLSQVYFSTLDLTAAERAQLTALLQKQTF